MHHGTKYSERDSCFYKHDINIIQWSSTFLRLAMEGNNGQNDTHFLYDIIRDFRISDSVPSAKRFCYFRVSYVIPLKVYIKYNFILETLLVSILIGYFIFVSFI